MLNLFGLCTRMRALNAARGARGAGTDADDALSCRLLTVCGAALDEEAGQLLPAGQVLGWGALEAAGVECAAAAGSARLV